MNETLYSFLDSRVEAELRKLASVPGLPMPEAVELGRPLLRSRLEGLVKPVVEAWLEEELNRINPAVALAPIFASAEDREKAEEETARRVDSEQENPFAKYPLLRRDADRIGENFRSFLESFLRRTAEHSGRIQRELLNGRPVGRLLSLGSSGADAHLHGRCALRVECEGGVFYYKPRDSRIDQLYGRIVAAFCPECTRSPRAVCGDGYGFIECMKKAPIQSREEAAEYYRNFGAITALFRFLGSSDMHFENIIACGVYPVAIDLETMLTPVPDPYNGNEVSGIDELNPVWRDMLCSVQSTLVLPMMLQGKVQISPLLGNHLDTAQSLPELEGEQIPVYGYEEEFIKGFGRMYDTLLSRREELGRMAREAADMSARFVMRASAYYDLMLKEMHSPAGCGSEQGRKDVLADLNTHYKDHPEYLPLVEWERSCLEEGDIPYFSFRAGHSGLYGDPRGEKLFDPYFKMTAVERCLVTLERSNPEEKRFEKDYIRRRFRQGTDLLPETGEKPDSGTENKESHPTPITAEEARTEARKILDDIWELTLRLTDGDRILLSANKHLVPEYFMNFERGMPGMSLFFDRIRNACPDPGGETARKAGSLLEETRKDLLRSVRTYGTMSAALRGILHPGICKGPSGLFLSPCLDDGMLEGILTALNLTGRGFEQEKPGLADGIAGLMFGCTTAYGRVQDPSLRETLMALIVRLAAMLRERLENPKAYSGLNHGMSGVGFALVRAWQLTGNDEYLEMAQRGFLLENEQYRTVLGGWPDYGKAAQPVVIGEHLEAGAPGIALAAVLCEQKVPAAKTVADRAIACTLQIPFRETDDLATGNAGIAMTLITAASCRRDPELLQAAGVQLKKMAERAERDGGYRSLPCRLRNVPDPSLWYGYAGIGYTMLAYADACGLPERQELHFLS